MRKNLLIIIIFIITSVISYSQIVVDNGAFLNNTEKSKLIKQTENIEKETSVEILIFTTKSLNGKTPLEYGKNLFIKYKVGIKGVNNGIIILLSKNDRKMQILTGFGMEWIISNKKAQEMINNMIPYFKKNDYFTGVSKSLSTIYNMNSNVDWRIYSENLDKVNNEYNGKIIKFKFENSDKNTKFKYAIENDEQYSTEFKIQLGNDYNNFNLYYSKYMNELISKILTKSEIIIFARIKDFKSKKIELIGIE